MLAPTERAPSPLPSALLAAELGPAVMADDSCEAAFAVATPTGPRKYYRARYYDPKLGRFISEDPIGFDGGVNFYTYVSNNPASHVDPFGLQQGSASPSPSPSPLPAMFAQLCSPGKLLFWEELSFKDERPWWQRWWRAKGLLNNNIDIYLRPAGRDSVVPLRMSGMGFQVELLHR